MVPSKRDEVRGASKRDEVRGASKGEEVRGAKAAAMTSRKKPTLHKALFLSIRGGNKFTITSPLLMINAQKRFTYHFKPRQQSIYLC